MGNCVSAVNRSSKNKPAANIINDQSSMDSTTASHLGCKTASEA